jgi:hypothetical protein
LFDLVTTLTIIFGENGVFTVEPGDWMEKEPENQVLDYMIRTGWCSAVLKGPRLKASRTIGKYDRHHREDVKAIAEGRVNELKNLQANSIFNFTKFDPGFVYRLYHPSVEKQYQTDRASKEKSKEKKVTESYKGSPEDFQVLMVASELMKQVFGEECMQPILQHRVNDEGKKKTYEEAFGSKEAALKNVPYLEANTGCLPILGKIPVAEFRRCISPNLAAIVSFFAIAIYDESSFNLALVLLMDESLQTGTPIPQAQKLFGDEFEYDELRLRNGVQMSLFEHDTVDEGANFVENVVEPLNKYWDYVWFNGKHLLKAKRRKKGDEMPLTENEKVVDKQRIQALLFRTTASDLVEIIVSHGLFLRMTSDCEEKHPWLMDLFNYQKKWPIPLLLEYIIIAIESGKIEIGSSYLYRRSHKKGHNLIRFRAPVQALVKDANGNSRPKIRDIRVLYYLVGAKVITGRKDSKQHKDFKEWLKLPEVVNVILFGMRNPFVAAQEEAQWIEWTPDFPNTDKRVKLWTRPLKANKEDKNAASKNNSSDEEDKNVARLPEKKDTMDTFDALDDEDDDGPNTTGLKSTGEEDYDVTENVSPAEDKKDMEEWEGDDEEGEDEDEDEDEQVEEDDKDEQVEDGKADGESAGLTGGPPSLYDLQSRLLDDTGLLDDTKNLLVQAIQMGSEMHGDGGYIELLESIKQMGITVSLLAETQRQACLDRETLVLREDCEVNDVLTELENYQFQQDKLPADGVYGKPPAEDDTWNDPVAKVNKKIESSVKQLVLPALRYNKRFEKGIFSVKELPSRVFRRWPGSAVAEVVQEPDPQRKPPPSKKRKQADVIDSPRKSTRKKTQKKRI